MMYTPAVEAAKCGHAIALTKACEERRKIAVSESKRCTSPGQVETKAVETSDNLDTTREDVRKNGANGQAHDEKEQNLGENSNFIPDYFSTFLEVISEVNVLNI